MLNVTHKPTVLIYRDHLLNASETFILKQTSTLKRYEPAYVGSRRVPGLPLPPESVFTLSHGGLVGKAREAFHAFFACDLMLARRVAELRPLLIHTHFGTSSVGGMRLARRLRLPHIITFHGFDATATDEVLRANPRHRLYLNRRETIKQEAEKIIAVSDYIQGKLLEQGFPESKIFRHYIGVDTTFFQPSTVAEREPVVLFIGRLVEKKGCRYLIEAMRKVERLVPQVQLVIIGDGPLRAELELQAQTALRHYKFLGHQPQDIVKQWMNRARVFCGPSHRASSGDAEGFGIVFIEAQAMQLPVVSFANAGVVEAVNDGQTGLLVAERDIRALANAIVCLLTNDSTWRAFSISGRQRVEQKFNLALQTAKLESIYDDVAGLNSAER